MLDRTTPQISVLRQGPGQIEPARFDADVERRFLSLAYEDKEKGADICKITLNNYDLRFPDDPAFDRGNKLVVSWGYAGAMSPPRRVVITDWLPGPTFEIEAKDEAVLMNKIVRPQTYQGLRRWSDVARVIAERNGYGPTAQDIQESGVADDDIVQPTWTDGQMLQQIANRLGWIFYVDSKGLHLHERRLGQSSRKTLRYFRTSAGEVAAESDMLAHPKFEKAPAAQPGKVTLEGINPKTKQPFRVTADNQSTAGRSGLASVLEVVDRRTLQTSLREAQATETIARTTATNEDQARREAAQLFKNAQSNPVKGSVAVRGDPFLTAKTVITLEGLGIRLSGSYYVNSIAHAVKPGEYTMTLKFTRDGTSSAGSSVVSGPTSAADVNKTKGPIGNAATNQLAEIEVVDERTLQTRTEFR